MDDLLFHPRSKAELLAFAQEAPQGLLIIAPQGMGKLTVAKAWAALLTAPHLVMVIGPDEKGTIPIETIRLLYQRTRSKQPGRQVIIIDHAEAMGAEAQNALLKLLEEPREGVTFVLTAPHSQSLLPTIQSRLQTTTLLPVSSATLSAFAANQADAQTLAQMLFVAAGRPGVLVTLLQNPQAFATHKQIMQQAKQLLNASAYERLSHVPELSKDRAQTIAVLEAMSYILEQYIRKEPSANLLSLADSLQTCLARLQQNGNLRAQLTHVFMGQE